MLLPYLDFAEVYVVQPAVRLPLVVFEVPSSAFGSSMAGAAAFSGSRCVGGCSVEAALYEKGRRGRRFAGKYTFLFFFLLLIRGALYAVH